MGNFCTRIKSTIKEEGATGGTQEPPGGAGGSAPAGETRKESQQHETAAPAAGTGPDVGAAALQERSHSSASAAGDLDSFTMGEGCGVYLVEEKALNGTLVTQYAKEKPTTDEGLVLLQVKAPPYKPIPASRFTLQGGKRVLKQDITASTKNSAGQAKYCGLVMDFVRLADVYKGFLWASPHLDEALQPLSLFVVETKQRTAAVSALQRGGTAVPQANGDIKQQQGSDAAVSADKRTPGEGQDTGTAGEGSGEKQERQNDSDKDIVETKEPASGDTEDDDRALYVQYLEGGSALPYRLLDRCGILPFPLGKAQEIIPAWSKVESLEDLRKKVEGVGGILWCTESAS